MNGNAKPAGTSRPDEDNMFVVEVKFRQNATWQGTVRWGSQQQQNFRSTLELLRMMDDALASREEAESPAP